MTTLYAVFGLLAVAVSVNLVLTARLAGAVRQISALSPALLGSPDEFSLPPGYEVPPFETTSVQGQPVSMTAMEEFVVGFFLVGCPPCKEAVDEYAALAERLADSGVSAIAVIRYEASDLEKPEWCHELASETERLSRTAVVVHEESAGGIITAFNVTAYPLFYRVRREGERHVVIAEAPTSHHFYRLEPV
ncbi:redoxin domain-containing protein [Streptomyces mirabilis]|uniref:redoxin domain-containing protein n=1 Tax=Streptomyces mirabilis TaxID=68239 RepID=UPI0036C3AD00